IDNEEQARKANLARLRVDLGAHLGFLTISRARRLLHRVLHRGEHDAAVDRLLARDGVDDLQEFESVGAYGHRVLLREVPRASLGRSGPRWMLGFRFRSGLGFGLRLRRRLARALGLLERRLFAAEG